MKAILHPLRFGDATQRLKLAEACRRNGNEAAAELILLSSLNVLTPREEDNRSEHRQQILANRGLQVDSAPQRTPARPVRSMLISEIQTQRSPEPLMSEITSYRRIVSPAGEDGYLLAIREFTSGNNSLDRFDLSNGYRIDEVSLPFLPENFTQPPRQAMLPKMILSSNSNNICAVSVAQAGETDSCAAQSP